MSSMDITLFGSPRITIDGVLCNNRIDKTVALIATLVLSGPSLDRDSLIAYLWTGSEMSKAQGALRTALWRLRTSGFEPWLSIERDIITFRLTEDTRVDVLEFQMLLDQARHHSHPVTETCSTCIPLLTKAVEIYRGEFMSGYNLRNAAGFDEWRTQTSNLVQHLYLSTLEKVVAGLFQQAQYTQAINYGRRWLIVDPYNENAHSLLLRAFMAAGQRANAVAHYRNYKRKLEKSLNLSPSEEITSLYKQFIASKRTPGDVLPKLKLPILLQIEIDQASQLFTTHGNAMEQVLAGFSSLVKSSSNRYGGRILQQTGDNITLLFSRGQPLDWAIQFHHMMDERTWENVGRLPIKMALTTGTEAQYSLPEYSVGLFICSQLLQAASSNQILMTSWVTEELEPPISTHIQDLGSYSMPGQINPVQISELIHPYLHDLKPHHLPSLSRSPANLPIQSTRFVGRETELAQLAELLAQPECRLLTLVGPGGVGKTRLGIQALNQIRTSSPDGIFFVPLVTHQDPSTIYHPIAAALKLAFNNPFDQASQLIDYLRNKQILLLLDNFEHLLPAATYLVELLEAAPGLRIIITSRERLNLYLETIFQVRGLPYPMQPDDPGYENYSGVKLFTQNATRVSPGFILHPEDRASIILICALTDGLPLGIELASSWVRAFTCREIASSIQGNLDFLRTGSPDVPTRHRSLRAAFDHSWGLLSEEARRTIRRLSIFRNGFTAQAAQKLANASSLMLADYVDKSLVTRQSTGRYEMPETLRIYAEEKLHADPQEYQTYMDAFSEFYSEYLDQKFGDFSREAGALALEEVRLENDNIQHAMVWAMNRDKWPVIARSVNPLFTFYELTGRIREGYDLAKDYLSRLVDLTGMLQPDIYYPLIGWVGWSMFRLGFYEEGLKKLHIRLEYAQKQGFYADSASTLMLLADAYRRLGDHTKALELISQSCEILNQLGAKMYSGVGGVYGYALTIKGSILLNLDQIEEARQALDESKHIMTEAGSRYGLIRLLDVQAALAVKDGNYEDSRRFRMDGLDIAEEFGDRRSTALILNNLSQSAENLNDYQEAILSLEKALSICDEIGDRQLAAVSNNNLGYYTLRYYKKPEQSIAYYQKSLEIFRELDNLRGVYYTLRDISRPLMMLPDISRARDILIEALQIGDQLGEPEEIIQILPMVARLLALTGQPPRAQQLCSLVINQPTIDPVLLEEAKSICRDLGSGNPDEVLPTLYATEIPTFQELLAEI